MDLLLNLAFFIADKIPIVRKFTMTRLARDFGLNFNISENSKSDFFMKIVLNGMVGNHDVYIADRYIGDALRTVVRVDNHFLEGKENEVIPLKFQDGHLTSVYELRKILNKLK